jgi:hypothetical protein
MNRKQQFLNAVQILAPNDKILYQSAESIAERNLPLRPGGAALEFVVAMQRFRRMPVCRYSHPNRRRCSTATSCHQHQLSLSQGLRVKGTEYWLKLGQPVQAMMELQRLSEAAKKHPWVVSALVAATRAVDETNQTQPAVEVQAAI